MPQIANSPAAVLGAMMALVCGLALSAGPALAAQSDPARDVERVVQLTNLQRSSAGLAQLRLSAELSKAAQNYSQVLASGACFEHVCGSVPNFADRLTRAGYTDWTNIGENIAAGYPTPEAVVAGWMASSGHRANMLSPDYTELGVGVVSGRNYGMYWTQEFGARNEAKRMTLQPVGDAENTADPTYEQP